ncbi:MAG: hypothetical protein K0R54_123 [Clostridiaceae bacterium]|jgi:hypothetical protein|nr:hypothetical protein [Clostridiaceae bacterium]
MNVRNEVLKTLARCRVLKLTDAIKQFDITEEDIDKMLEEKIITKEFLEFKRDFVPVIIEYFQLSDKGEKFVKDIIVEINEIYRGFILEHDLSLCEYYLERTKEERETWLTRDDMIKRYKSTGTIDGAFMNKNNQLEGIEIMSKNSKPSVIEKTEEFIKIAEIKKMNYILY